MDVVMAITSSFAQMIVINVGRDVDIQHCVKRDCENSSAGCSGVLEST
jgi:hypothetical protein